MKTKHIITVITLLSIISIGELVIITNLQDKIEKLELSLEECRDENNDSDYIPGRILKRVESSIESKSQERVNGILDTLNPETIKKMQKHLEEYDKKNK